MYPVQELNRILLLPLLASSPQWSALSPTVQVFAACAVSDPPLEPTPCQPACSASWLTPCAQHAACVSWQWLDPNPKCNPNPNPDQQCAHHAAPACRGSGRAAR